MRVLKGFPVISSTMVGSTIRQGEWEISILVFVLTGIVGIVSILYKDRMIGFCRKITGRDKAFTKSQCLDFIEIAHRDKIYPIITCRMKYDGQMNVARLIESVRLSSVIVPEILYAYNYGRGCFVDAGFTASDVVQTGKEQPSIKIAAFYAIRDLTDDEATIIMVDSNLQREKIPDSYTQIQPYVNQINILVYFIFVLLSI